MRSDLGLKTHMFVRKSGTRERERERERNVHVRRAGLGDLFSVGTIDNSPSLLCVLQTLSKSCFCLHILYSWIIIVCTYEKIAAPDRNSFCVQCHPSYFFFLACRSTSWRESFLRLLSRYTHLFCCNLSADLSSCAYRLFLCCWWRPLFGGPQWRMLSLVVQNLRDPSWYAAKMQTKLVPNVVMVKAIVIMKTSTRAPLANRAVASIAISSAPVHLQRTRTMAQPTLSDPPL